MKFINKIMDKVLLYLIYRRQRKLSDKIDGKTFLSSDYAKRRRTYEYMVWEIKKNDLYKSTPDNNFLTPTIYKPIIK